MAERKPYGPPYPTRIEPDLGVPVLTQQGFLMKEADRKGTTFQDEMEDHMTAERDLQEDFLASWHNTDYVLGFARDWLHEQNQRQAEYNERWPEHASADFTALPRQVLLIQSFEGGCSFRGWKVHVSALAVREHGRRDILHVSDFYEHGHSYYDPPEGETEVWWESEHPEAK